MGDVYGDLRRTPGAHPLDPCRARPQRRRHQHRWPTLSPLQHRHRTALRDRSGRPARGREAAAPPGRGRRLRTRRTHWWSTNWPCCWTWKTCTGLSRAARAWTRQSASSPRAGRSSPDFRSGPTPGAHSGREADSQRGRGWTPTQATSPHPVPSAARRGVRSPARRCCGGRAPLKPAPTTGANQPSHPAVVGPISPDQPLRHGHPRRVTHVVRPP